MLCIVAWAMNEFKTIDFKREIREIMNYINTDKIPMLFTYININVNMNCVCIIPVVLGLLPKKRECNSVLQRILVG
jgi:hypothetical protein